MRITVVLKGELNDKDTFQTAVRLAARENGSVRVILGPDCSREKYEMHLHFVLWDVRERLRLPPPEITLEVPLDWKEQACSISELKR
jgi:hypothetical protein